MLFLLEFVVVLCERSVRLVYTRGNFLWYLEPFKPPFYIFLLSFAKPLWASTWKIYFFINYESCHSPALTWTLFDFTWS